MTQNSDFVEKNIDRLIKQCEYGDEAMTFLAIYSFIEGYFRDLYPSEFKYEDDIKFHHIMDKIKSRHLKTSFPAEINLYETLKKYHGEKNPNAYKNLRTAIDTNRIRHCFSNIRPGTLSVIVGQFIDFARYRGFLTDEISNLNTSKQVLLSRSSILLEPTDDSVLYAQKNDLFTKYSDISNLINEKTRIASELENIDSQIINESNIQNLQVLIRNKKEKTEYLTKINAKLDTLREYTDFINELAISLIEARSKKNYETQIIHLSEAQKRLIKEDLDGLTEKEGHSMYIKGGPGTGKTLVLIVILFKLYSAQHKSVLLTYYPTLNKYISYLFELYNDDKLLNYFGLSKIDSIALDALGSSGILKFDDFLLPKIRKLLSIKNTYSLRENTSKLSEACHSVELNPRKAATLYKEIVENILPNMLIKQTYCTTQRKTERWEKISKILEALDNSENMLDLYAYYKFCIKNISKIALTNESFDYILIDEAQDLTNAQIFAVNKFVNKKGGLILAGDPSQEIRNKRITMAQLDVNITGGARYSQELTQNFRSSKLIQDLGNEYKQEPCLHIRKNTKSVEGITAGPPPQIFITDDTEDSDYQNTYTQIVTSVRMCTEDLCITPENICIVAFNEPELLVIQKKLDTDLNMKSALIYKDFSFKNNSDVNGKIRLCTLREIKGIDCAVLLFMVTDQSKQKNNGGFMPELKSNAIYTCITRAMYLLQVFIPKYCRMSDLSVAVLVNKLCPSDTEVAEFVEEQNKKERKGIPLKAYFEKYKGEPESEVLRKIEVSLKEFYEQKFGSDENCIVDPSEDLSIAYIYARKKVVHDVQDKLTEISLNEALSIRPECTIDDEIEVYINPNDLNVRLPENAISMNKGSSSELSEGYVKILTDIYERFPERRTDENGNPQPSSNEGYLNISNVTTNSSEFGYGKWTDLIKDNCDSFDYIIYPYKNGFNGTVFAFRPKIMNTSYVKDSIPPSVIRENHNITDQPSTFVCSYKGIVLEKTTQKMQISTSGMPVQYRALTYFPAYSNSNSEIWNLYNQGDTVYFEIIDNPVMPGKKMAKLLKSSNTSNTDIDNGWFLGKITNANIVVVNQYMFKRPNGTKSWRSIKDKYPEKPYAYISEDLYKSKCEIGTQIEFGLKKLDVYKTIDEISMNLIVNGNIIVHPPKSKTTNNRSDMVLFVAESIGTNKNLKGRLIPAIDNIDKGSISQKVLTSRGYSIDENLIGKRFQVRPLEINPQGTGWILDIENLIS